MNAASYQLVQAIRGPLMLIVLGVLVLIDYMGIFGFSRTWPILIIVFGCLKLAEKALQHGDPVPPPSFPRSPGGNAI